MTRCVLVDDDAALRTLQTELLGRHGIAVEALPDGAALRARLPAGDVDVLVLDVMLPDGNGLDLCQWAKRLQPALPVVMLTAQGDPLSRVLGLELGADDYLPKPFEPRELVARIRATLRRGRQVAAALPTAGLSFGGWRFDRVQRQLHDPAGTVVPLSAAEFRLLCAFVDHPGHALGRERLLALTRTPGADARSVDLAVSRLRAKLGDTAGAPMWIRTVRGEGYLFDPHARV